MQMHHEYYDHHVRTKWAGMYCETISGPLGYEMDADSASDTQFVQEDVNCRCAITFDG